MNRTTNARSGFDLVYSITEAIGTSSRSMHTRFDRFAMGKSLDYSVRSSYTTCFMGGANSNGKPYVGLMQSWSCASSAAGQIFRHILTSVNIRRRGLLTSKLPAPPQKKLCFGLAHSTLSVHSKAKLTILQTGKNWITRKRGHSHKWIGLLSRQTTVSANSGCLYTI